MRICATNTKTQRRNEFMNEKAKEARRAYKRKWYQENKDKVKAYNAKYWSKKAAELKAQQPAEANNK